MIKDVSKIPESWIETSVRDLFDVEYGKSLTKSKRVTTGTYPVVGSSGVVGNHDDFLIPGPSIVVGRKGSVGSLTYLKSPSWPIDTVYYIRPTNELNIKFVYYQLSTKELVRLDKSTTIPSLNRDDFYSVKINLCSPAEQARIVEKLEELLTDLENGVTELKAAQTKLGNYRQSLLKSAVEGSLTKQWRKANDISETGKELLQRILVERRQHWEAQKLTEFKDKGKKIPDDWKKKYPEPVQPDTSALRELPGSWVWTSVKTSGSVQLGRQRSPKYHEGENMLPYLRVANVFEDRIDIGDVKTMHFSKDDEKSYLLKNGDVLLNEGQSLELIGRPAIFRGELKKVCFTNTLVRYRSEKTVLSEFALIVFRHYFHSGRFQKIAKYTTNIAHLGAGRFAEIELPIPPISEQVAVIEIFSNASERLEDQLNNIELGLKSAEAQRKNILQDAFFGKLVEQDPNDEPANMLLERIQADRAALAKLPKPKHSGKRTAKVDLMKSLEEVLKNKHDWVDAQIAFKACGLTGGTDGSDTDRIEGLYAELGVLDKAGLLDIKREGDYDLLRLKGK